MATTVTYKGQTLTTVENETKVLETAGTWVEDDFTLTDVSGGGGSSDKWQRPSDFPDYSKVDLTNDNVLYLTYKTGTDNSYAIIKPQGKTNSATFTFDVGTLTDGIFTVLDTDTVTHNTVYSKSLKEYASDYVVIRMRTATGELATVSLNQNATIDDTVRKYYGQYLVEAYGRLPTLTSLDNTFRWNLNLQSLTLYGMTSLTNCTRICGDAYALENVYIDGTVAGVNLYFAFAVCRSLKYVWLNGMTISNFQNAFDSSPIEYTDIDSCSGTISNANFNNAFGGNKLKSLDLSNFNITTTGQTSAFVNCYKLKSLNVSTFSFTGGANNLFASTPIEEIPQADYSGINNTTNMFNGSRLIGSVTMPVTADVQFRTAFQYCRLVNSITIPASYTGQIVAQAFRDTPSLTEIHFQATTPPPLANKNAFNYGETNASRKIYVPYSADHSVLEAYQNASVWSTIDYPIVEEPE